MLTEWLIKMMNNLAGPFSKGLQKSPKMVAAKTEADILKAEEDFEKRGDTPRKAENR